MRAHAVEGGLVRLRALLGLALVCAGQACMLWRGQLLWLGLGQRMNDAYLLDLPNADNVLIALVLLALGALLCAPALRAARVGDALIPPSLALALPPRDALIPGAALAIGLALLSTTLYELARAVYYPALVWRWLLAVGALVAAALLLDRRTGARLSPGLAPLDAALVAGVSLAGLAIASYRLAEIPAFLWLDEAPFLQRARAIAAGADRPGIFDLGVFTFPMLSSHYQALVMRLAGGGLWGWRLSSVLAATLALGPTYLLARELFDRRIALLAGVAMMATPFFLAFARLGYNNAQSLIPVTLALYCLYAGLRRGSALYGALGGVAAGLGFYTYTGARLGAALGALLLGALVVRHGVLLAFPGRRSAARLRLLSVGLCGGAFILVCAATALPHLVYAGAVSPERANQKMIETLLANVEYARVYLPGEDLFRDAPPIQAGAFVLFYRPDLYAYLLVRGMARSFLAFQHDDLVVMHFIVGPLAGTVGAVFYVLGLFGAVASLRRAPAASGLLLAWFVGGVAALSGIHTWVPRHAHMVPLIPALSMLIALGIAAASDMLGAATRPGLQERRGRPAGLLALGLAGLVAANGLWGYFGEMPRAYQPRLLEQAVRLSLDLRPGETLVYVARDEEERRQSNWLRASVPPGSGLIQSSLSDLSAGTVALAPGRPYRVLFHEQDAPLVLGYLDTRRGHAAPLQPQPLLDGAGQIIGMEVLFLAE